MRNAFPVLLTLLALGLPGAARADAIDGDWCFADRRNLSIQGPEIRTPGGHRIRGEYGRHYFSYVVPPGEPGAGQPVAMTLLDEDDATFAQGPAGQAPVLPLKRCDLHTS